MIIRLLVLLTMVVSCIEQPEGYDYFPQFEKDVKRIRAYVKQNNLQVDSTDSGLFFTLMNAGSPTLRVTSESLIRISYRARLLDSEFYFVDMFTTESTSLVSIRRNANQLLPALRESLMMLGQGGRIVVLSPSLLAYGRTGLAPHVPPDEVVVFDIRVTEVLNPE